jgi:crotonobetainyl-CoA:carnitine CoA-transferase CaiB-like acyl-CoA transferase
VTNRQVLRAELAKAILEQPRDEWTARFRRSGIIAGPVLAHGEVMRSEEARQNNTFVQSKCGDLRYTAVRMPFSSDAYETQDLVSAPQLGADTDKVLAELGYSPEAITALRDSGTIAAR